MSMNLYFYSKIHNLDVDFPFQTPTELSYEVLREKSNKKRLEIIKIYIEENYDDKEYQQYILNKISDLLDDENLELSIS